MGTKRKIPIQKLETKKQTYVTFSKRRSGLYKKAAYLCNHFRARIAVLANAPSSDSKFYSFDHPSAKDVVDAFLENRVPKEAIAEETERSVPNEGFWWEDGFEHCQGDDLRCVIDQLQKLRVNVAAKLKSDYHGNEVGKEMGVFAELGYDPQDIYGNETINLPELSSESFYTVNAEKSMQDIFPGTSTEIHENNVENKINESNSHGSNYDFNDTVNAITSGLGLVHQDENFGMLMEDDVGLYQLDSISELQYLDPPQGLDHYIADYLQSNGNNSTMGED